MSLINKPINRHIAIFFLILMCVQYLPVEGYRVSYIKFTAMCCAPFIWFITSPKFSRAWVLGGIYFTSMFLSAIYNIDSFRLSSIGYILSFIFMFVLYYNLVYCERVFELDYFIKLMKRLLMAFFICLVLQQLTRFLGFESFPLINLVKGDHRGSMIGNSLSIEQSHAARIVVISFLALLRMYEIKYRGVISVISALYSDSKWVVIGFLWTIITMGSATAIMGFGILLLYFIRRNNLLISLPLLITLYFVTPYIDFVPLQRVKATLEAAATLDPQEVIKADMSAAARVVPFLNTINYINLTEVSTWVGNGTDTNASVFALDKGKTIGSIADYGIVVYFFSLLLVYGCCIRKFFSLESLVFLVLMMATVHSIAFMWGGLMILTTVRYFQINADRDKLTK